jgi:hypothetical protein
MSQNRICRTILASAFLAGAWGAFSAAVAQASGTMQASVTVADDAVNRALAAGIPAYVSKAGNSGLLRPGALPLADRGSALDTRHVRATIRELPGERGARRVRVEVAYLQ